MLVSLIGLPGVGKSTLGRRLAERLDFAFLDCDSEVERRLGQSIASFFQEKGEVAFRDQEEAVLQEAVRLDRTVLATGGGVVLRQANRALLRSHTACIYLRAEPRLLLSRLGRSGKRPLLNVGDVKGRLQAMALERESLYQETASIVVDTAGHHFNALLNQLETALQPYNRPQDDRTAP